MVLTGPAVRAAALVLAAACGACAPWPTTRYVAVVPPGELVHSSCAFNAHVPVGVRMPVGAATAHVTVARHRGRPYLGLQLDVPPGTTLRFEADALEVVARRGAPAGGAGAGAPAAGGEQAPGPVTTARFQAISLVDNPLAQLDGTTSADVRARQLAIDAPMPGGPGMTTAGVPVSGPTTRHYWLAAYLDLAQAEAFEVRLPPLVEEGRQVHRLRAVFEPRTVVVVALLNC